jgi:hypothetical protein
MRPYYTPVSAEYLPTQAPSVCQRTDGLERVVVGRAAVTPLRCAVRASRKPGVTFLATRTTHALRPWRLRETRPAPLARFYL